MLIQVNYAALDAAAAQANSTWSRLLAEFEDLQSRVNQLRASWDGTAQQAYQGYQQRWSTAAQDLNQALQGIQRGLNQANTNFQSAENANTRGWG